MDITKIATDIKDIILKSDLANMESLVMEIAAYLGRYTIKHRQEHRAPDLLDRVRQFLTAKKIDGLSPKTLENYEQILSLFTKRVEKNITQINTEDLRQYLVYLSDERGLKETSIQTHFSTLRSFFSWLQTEGLLKRNPILKIRPKRIDKKKSRHALSTEELERLRDMCVGYREKALVEFLYSTGCRVSEVAGISIDSVDFFDRSVRVWGKGGKERIVYFSVKAKLMITEYLNRRSGGSYLFCGSKRPHNPLSTRAIQKIIASIGERATIPRRVHPHLLRHTFATSALNAGMDITVIQHLLGHADVGTTQIYAEVNPASVRREYERFVA